MNFHNKHECGLCRYRLYPEVHFPVPYLDCLAAAKHFLSPGVLSSYKVDPQRVGIAGDSAGGNLAAAVVQEVGVSPEDRQSGRTEELRDSTRLSRFPLTTL